MMELRRYFETKQIKSDQLKNSFENHERINHCIRNILDLSPKDRKDLKLKIKEHNGNIRIFVHPFFLEWYKGYRQVAQENYKSRYSKVEIIKRILARILEKETTPPALIFEEQDKINVAKELIIKSMNNLPRQVYIVPTYSKSPEPKMDIHDVTDSKQGGKNWKKLIRLLRKLDVKKITIGGIYLEIDTDYPRPVLHSRNYYRYYQAQRKRKSAQNTDYVLTRCVGTAASILSKNFDVEVSSLAFPDSRLDIKQVEQSV